MSRDDRPSDPPGSAASLLKLADVFAIAKIYGGLAYLGSIQGSPADRARLRRGDVVLAVNGMPTPDLMSFLQARQLRDGGCTVRYLRDGVETEVELTWQPLRTPSHPPDVH
jgi:S1-C subfamily serine protease